MFKRSLFLFSLTLFSSQRGIAQEKDTLPCPFIKLIGPAKDYVAEGKPAMLSVKPFGNAYAKYRLTYNWTVSNGTIVAGQGTAAIKVDTKGLKGQFITASVEVGGLRYDCTNFSSLTMEVTGKN